MAERELCESLMSAAIHHDLALGAVNIPRSSLASVCGGAGKLARRGSWRDREVGETGKLELRRANRGLAVGGGVDGLIGDEVRALGLLGWVDFKWA
jgi:hypothetical protein